MVNEFSNPGRSTWYSNDLLMRCEPNRKAVDTLAVGSHVFLNLREGIGDQTPGRIEEIAEVNGQLCASVVWSRRERRIVPLWALIEA
jgi:hypothetical protein